MKKTILTLRSMAVLLIFLAALTGCNRTVSDVLGSFSGGRTADSDGEQNAVKLNKESRYYNDFLGISFAVPKGWWLYQVNEDNFSPSQGDTADEISLDMEYDDYEDYSYSLLRLISFGSLEKSNQQNHLGFHLDAQTLKGIDDMAGYMKYFEAFMLEPTEDEDYTLTESRQTTINGRSFELRNYLVSREEDNFYVITFTCQVKEGFFFNISVDYWPENAKAEQAAIDTITRADEFY